MSTKAEIDHVLRQMQQGVRRMKPLVAEQQPERDRVKFPKPAMVVRERWSRSSYQEQMEKRGIEIALVDGTTMMEIPIFYGEDPEAWVSWIEAFVAANGLTDFETRQLAYGFIGGEAHTWYRDEESRCPFYSWGGLKFRLIKRFSTRSESEKAKLEWQHRLKQLDRLNEWLERRYPEKSRWEKQQEEASMVTEETEKICIGGKRSTDDLVPEPIPSLTEPEKKNEIHVFVSDAVTHVVVCEKGEEEPVADIEDLFEETQPAEKRVNTRKKKKRWKKRFLAIQTPTEKDIFWSGFVCEEDRQVQGKDQRKIDKDQSTPQAFDRRSERRKEATKRRTVKGTKLYNRLVSARGQYQRLNCRRLCLILVLNKRFHLGVLKKKKNLGLEEHDVLRGTLYLRGKRVKMKSKRLSLTKSKGWTHEAREGKSETQKLQRESVTTLGKKRVTERDKRVSGVLVDIHQKFNRQWLLSFIRDFSKLAGDVTVVIRSAKRKRMKFKHNHKKQKKWIKKLFSVCSWSNQWRQLSVLVKLSRQWSLVADRFSLHKKSGVKLAFRWSDKVMQLEDIVKFLWKLFLAAVKRKADESKCMRRGCAELLRLKTTVEPLKDQRKPDKRIVKRDKIRRWKYKLWEMELSLQLSLVKKDGTSCERKSVEEEGKCNHKGVELMWISCNISDNVLPQQLDSTRTKPSLQWLNTLKSKKVNWKEQVESARNQTLPFTDGISEYYVSAFLTASQSKETFSEADMNQELKRVTHILQRRAQGSVLMTQTTIGKFCGLLGSVFLVRGNMIKFLELVKKSLTATRCSELRNRVWEPGVVAYVGEWKVFEALLNGVLDGGLSDY